MRDSIRVLTRQKRTGEFSSGGFGKECWFEVNEASESWRRGGGVFAEKTNAQRPTSDERGEDRPDVREPIAAYWTLDVECRNAPIPNSARNPRQPMPMR